MMRELRNYQHLRKHNRDCIINYNVLDHDKIVKNILRMQSNIEFYIICYIVSVVPERNSGCKR